MAKSEKMDKTSAGQPGNFCWTWPVTDRLVCLSGAVGTCRVTDWRPTDYFLRVWAATHLVEKACRSDMRRVRSMPDSVSL